MQTLDPISGTPRPRLFAAMIGPAMVAMAACSSPTGSDTLNLNPEQTIPPAVVITVLDGDNQQVPAQGMFPKPVLVSATVDGRPAAGVAFHLIEPESPNGWISGSQPHGDGVLAIQPKVGGVQGPYTMSIYYPWCKGRVGLFSGMCQGTWAQLGTVTVSGVIVEAD